MNRAQHARAWSRGLLAILAGGGIACTAFGADDSLPLKTRASELKALLASLPYSTEGSGPVVYLIEYSSCPYAQRLERDWAGTFKNFEVRRVFYGVDDPTSNNAGALVFSRSASEQRAYMFGGRRAAPLASSPKSNTAYNELVDSLENLIGLMRANGYSHSGPSSPMMFYSDGRQVYFDSGYEKPYFTRNILPRLRKAAASAQASDPLQAAAAVRFTLAARVALVPGNEAVRGKLSRYADFRPIVEGDFLFGGVDLNGDGNKEVVLVARSAQHCSADGCDAVVYEARSGGSDVTLLLRGRLPTDIGITNESRLGYHLLARVSDVSVTGGALADADVYRMDGSNGQ